MELPTLSELLRWDYRKGNLRDESYEHRRLDGNPLYWRYMRSMLLALDDCTLSMVVLKVPTTSLLLLDDFSVLYYCYVCMYVCMVCFPVDGERHDQLPLGALGSAVGGAANRARSAPADGYATLLPIAMVLCI